MDRRTCYDLATNYIGLYSEQHPLDIIQNRSRIRRQRLVLYVGNGTKRKDRCRSDRDVLDYLWLWCVRE